ncbi:MAG: TlpA family protein disulfide reductase [Granulosicoccus sp.]|nr:TlpA family protein disulfide reductase [Granulosicoccus sp.]
MKPSTITGFKLLVQRGSIGLLFWIVISAAGQANAFQLQSMNADRVHLSDYIVDGRWNLVMFWSTDCVPCEEQKPMIESFHQQHKDSRAVVLGIVTDGLEMKEEIDVLMKKHDPSYPNLVVFADVFYRQYEELTGKPFRVTPTYLLFSPAGDLVGARSGKIERQFIDKIVTGAAQ